MSIPLDELKQEAALLSDAERADLALSLIESLEAGAGEDGIDQAWLLEIQRRADQIDRGEVQSIPGDEVFARLRAQFG